MSCPDLRDENNFAYFADLARRSLAGVVASFVGDQVTNAVTIKLAVAILTDGKMANITARPVDDGGGTLPAPDPNQTKQVKEVWRNMLNNISRNKKNENYVVAELLSPPEIGCF